MLKLFLALVFIVKLYAPASAQDKNLGYFLEKAYQSSPLLIDYRNQVSALRYDSLLVRANYLPQIAANSLNTYAPLIKGFGYEQAVTNGGGLNAVIGVNQAFASKKNLDAQYNTIRIQRAGVENSAAVSRQDLKKAVTDQYITAYGTLQQLTFTRQVNDLLSKEETILKKLTEKNVYRQTDYLTFLVTLQQQQLTARQQEIQYRNDLGTLNYLSGLFDTTLVNLPDPALTLQILPSPEKSIFFRQYTLDSLGILNNKLLLDISYKPKFGLHADAGYNSTLAYNPYKNFGTSFGVNLSAPIYDGRKRKLQQSRYDIGFQTTSAYKNFAKTQYYQQVAQLRQQYDGIEELIGEITGQIRYSETLIKVNSKLLESGDTKIADLVISLNNYLTAKNLLTQNTISRLHIINQINYWNR